MRSYPSKLLLFGEYLIILNGQALAVPLPLFWSQWRRGGDSESTAAQASAAALQAMHTYFTQSPPPFALDMAAWADDLAAGDFLDTNIPLGYGLGSSGSVCAAVYDRYAPAPERDLVRLRAALATLESYFHGKSSGIDPLVSYCAEPLHLLSAQAIQRVGTLPDYQSGQAALFLLDTRLPRQASRYIQYFMQRIQDPPFMQLGIAPLQRASDDCLQAFLQRDGAALLTAAARLSDLQYRFLSYMIPPSLMDVWKAGMEHGGYFLKLCGAGGGGFLLGITPDWAQTQKQLAAYPLRGLYYW